MSSGVRVDAACRHVARGVERKKRCDKKKGMWKKHIIVTAVRKAACSAARMDNAPFALGR